MIRISFRHHDDDDASCCHRRKEMQTDSLTRSAHSLNPNRKFTMSGKKMCHYTKFFN